MCIHSDWITKRKTGLQSAALPVVHIQPQNRVDAFKLFQILKDLYLRMMT